MSRQPVEPNRSAEMLWLAWLYAGDRTLLNCHLNIGHRFKWRFDYPTLLRFFFFDNLFNTDFTSVNWNSWLCSPRLYRSLQSQLVNSWRCYPEMSQERCPRLSTLLKPSKVIVTAVFVLVFCILHTSVPYKFGLRVIFFVLWILL